MASAPIHHVAAAHHSLLAAFLSANFVQLSHVKADGGVSVRCIPTSVVVPQPLKPDQSDAARYAQKPHISFARLAEFSHSDQFLALTGDDKILRVWKVEIGPNGDVDGFELGKEILIKHLPKRAAILHWMKPRNDSATEELVVVDRFGDVRSFLLDPSSTDAPKPTSIAYDTADEQDEMDSPTDRSMQILFGHVGMIASIAFVPNRTDPQGPPPLVITGDRDEHIRISRWGPQRAAYVIERFLLGSQSFVGALAVVTDSTGSQRLITSEGGENLRVWSLPSSDTAGGECMSINTIGHALAPHVLIRERQEKKRESRALQASSKKSPQKRKHADDVAAESRSSAHLYSLDTKPTVVITRLLPCSDENGNTQVLIVVEGATAVFHLPLAALLESSGQRDLSDAVRIHPTELPVLSLALQTDAKGTGVTVFVTFDTRHEFQPESVEQHRPLPAGRTYSFAEGVLTPTASVLFNSIETASSDEDASRPLLDLSLVDTISLYPALTTWPKIETPSSAEIVATRTTRKGRFNHPLDTSLIGIHAAANDPANGSTAVDGEQEQRQQLVNTMQHGKRERGRERNREAIRQAQQQAPTPSS